MLAMILLAAASAQLGQAMPSNGGAKLTLPHTELRLEVCYRLAVEIVFPMRVGDCLGMARAADGVFRTGVCDFLSETAQLEDVGFRSASDCERRVP